MGDPYGEANATALRQDLEAVGFAVELVGLQTGQFFTDVYEPAARDLSSTYWSADYPDAQDYISTNFICGSFLNICHFCDEDIDAAFFATESMEFGQERDAALLEVQQRLIDEVAGIPIMEVTPQVVFGARGRHAYARHVCAVRLEAGLGEGRRLRPSWTRGWAPDRPRRHC